MHYAVNLDAILRRQGRKRVWLALRLGVTRSTVSRWLHGRVPFPVARVPELAEALGYARWEDLADDLQVSPEDREAIRVAAYRRAAAARSSQEARVWSSPATSC